MGHNFEGRKIMRSRKLMNEAVSNLKSTQMVEFKGELIGKLGILEISS